MKRVSIALICALAAASIAAETAYRTRLVAPSSYTGDGGPAAAAVLVQPEGMAFDARGALYIADAADNRVRRVDASGRISTVAARLNQPYDVCVDAAGDVYVADLGNRRVVKLPADGGEPVPVAGGGTANAEAFLPRPATTVGLRQPRNIAVDRAGMLYISDFETHRVYRVTPNGFITAIAGTGRAGYSGDGGPAVSAALSGPAGLAVDSQGTLYIADSGNRRVRRIVSGLIFTVEDADKKQVEFTTPISVAMDPAGKLYVGDGSGIVTTVSVAGALSFLAVEARTVALDGSGRIFVTASRQVRRFDNPGLAVIAGTGFGAFHGDGRPAAEWRFGGPSAIARDDRGNLLIADTGNGRVRKLTPDGDLTTVISGLGRPSALAIDRSGRLYIADAATGYIHAYRNGLLTLYSAGKLKNPSALAVDAGGVLHAADLGTNLIVRFGAGGELTTVAGGGGLVTDGSARTVKLRAPAGLAFDSNGDLWFTEAGMPGVRRISTGMITTFRGPDLMEPRGIRIGPGGSIYVADAGFSRVVRVERDGRWWPVAGRDEGLYAPVDLLVDEAGRVTVCDTLSGEIREAAPVEPAPIAPPAITLAPLSVLHTATELAEPIAPGQLVTLRAAGLRAGVAPDFGGLPATVLAVRADELVVRAPIGLRPGLVEVIAGEHRAAVDVVAAAPRLFAAIANEDGSRNGANAPAPRGSVVTFYGTGHGLGAAEVTVEIGGYPAEVLYAGPAPGTAGVFQINARTPSGFAPSGAQTLTATVNGVPTQAGLFLVTQ